MKGYLIGGVLIPESTVGEEDRHMLDKGGFIVKDLYFQTEAQRGSKKGKEETIQKEPEKKGKKFTPRKGKSGLITCAYCRAPITEVMKTWTHIPPPGTPPEKYVRDHLPMPEPEGKTAVNLTYATGTLTNAHDFIKWCEKNLSWKGPHTIWGSETFVVTVSVLKEEAATVMEQAKTMGLYAGSTARAVRSKDKDEPKEEKEAPAPGSLAEAKKLAKKEKQVRGSGPSGDLANWWACPKCKRRIKSGPEFHYGKEPTHRP